MELPVDYTKLDWRSRKMVREQYIELQDGICMFCSTALNTKPSANVTRKKVNWKLFPKNFLRYPVHLQHNHTTGMTEGAVHAYCNAVLWQYHGQ